VRRTLEKVGIQPARFYRWYDRFQSGGRSALEDKSPRPWRVWNRVPEAIRERIVQLALNEPELSPRELATRCIDTANYFMSEASVYQLFKARDLIASPAYIDMKAADELKDDGAKPALAEGLHLSQGGLAVVGSIPAQCWTTFHAISSPGSCARR
jgi:putative transposase